jgi:hypothetical protein
VLRAPSQLLTKLKSDFSFPADIKSRNMTKEEFTGIYRYRDDAEPLWIATYAWVESYLKIIYPDAKHLRKDTALSVRIRLFM